MEGIITLIITRIFCPCALQHFSCTSYDVLVYTAEELIFQKCNKCRFSPRLCLPGSALSRLEDKGKGKIFVNGTDQMYTRIVHRPRLPHTLLCQLLLHTSPYCLELERT